MRYLFSTLFFLIFLCVTVSANTKLQADTLTEVIDDYDSKINYDINGQAFHFKPDIRPLQQIPGGRQAFYTYLWDFGDGNFSTEEKPIHTYEKPGDYDVKLYATNNYDNGPPPKRPKRKTTVSSQLASNTKSTSNFQKHFFASNGVLQLYKNSDALPGQDMALIVGVKPRSEKGKIIILTNEKDINPNGFEFAHQSTYNNEIIDSAIFQEKHKLKSMWAQVKEVTKTHSGSPDYGNKETYHFDEKEALNYFSSLHDSYTSISTYDVSSQDFSEQFSIINLNVTPEMLADTNAIVTVTGIYLSEDGLATVHKLDIPVVTSHDPNKMSTKPARLNYRMQFKKRNLTYKVQFQNDGEGDAKNVRLEINLPKEVDPKTFQLLNLYPACDSCATASSKGCYTINYTGENTVEFLFKDIALPGTAAPDVADADSTKGFIRFNVQTYKKLKNKSLTAYTNIFFDKNDPIRTNNSVARFRKGLSPLILAGINQTLANSDAASKNTGVAFSFGLAPIAPYKKFYWQIELGGFSHTNTQKNFTQKRGEIHIPNNESKEQYKVYDGIDSISKMQNIRLHIPLQIRYNFNSLLSLGAGATIGTDINLSNKQETNYHIKEWSGEQGIYTIKNDNDKSSLSPIRYAPFIDLNIGRTYLGPALGVRYHFDNSIKHNGQVYFIWRL